MNSQGSFSCPITQKKKISYFFFSPSDKYHETMKLSQNLEEKANIKNSHYRKKVMWCHIFFFKSYDAWIIEWFCTLCCWHFFHLQKSPFRTLEFTFKGGVCVQCIDRSHLHDLQEQFPKKISLPISPIIDIQIGHNHGVQCVIFSGPM